MAVVVCKTPADEDDVLEAGKIFRCLAVPHKSVFFAKPVPVLERPSEKVGVTDVASKGKIVRFMEVIVSPIMIHYDNPLIHYQLVQWKLMGLDRDISWFLISIPLLTSSCVRQFQ